MGNNANQEPMDLKITTYQDGNDYVFISYASKDKDIVFDHFVKPLQEKYGLNVFCDLDFANHATENWSDQMTKNLKRAKLVLAFTSTDYVCSYACMLEIYNAIWWKVPILKIMISQPIPTEDTTSKNISEATRKAFKSMKDKFAALDKSDNKSKYYQYLLDVIEDIENGSIMLDDLSNAFSGCLGAIANTQLTTKSELSSVKRSIYNATTQEGSNLTKGVNVFITKKKNNENIKEATNNTPEIEKKPAQSKSEEIIEINEITENSPLLFKDINNDTFSDDDTEDVFSMDNDNSDSMDSDIFSDESDSSNSFKPANPDSVAVAWEGGEIADDDEWDDIPDQNAEDSHVETYTICGTVFSGNYKKILTDALTHIVNEHFEKFDMLAEKIPCLSDKSQSELSHMFPDDVSLFETEEFDFDGDIYTIGINIDRKTAFAHIRKAIMLTGENPHDYVIDGLYNEKQMIRAEKQYAEAHSPFAAFSSSSNPFKTNVTWGNSDDGWGDSDDDWGKADDTWGNTNDSTDDWDDWDTADEDQNTNSDFSARKTRGNSSEENYSVYGKSACANQSQMMADVMKTIVEKHFNMFNKLSKELNCLAKGPISKQRRNRVTYFKVGSEFTYEGVVYCIGTAYSRDAKLAQIRKAIILTGEDPHEYQIDGLFNDKQLKKAEQSFEEAQKAKAANKPAVASITAASPAKDIGKPSSENCYTFCGNTVSGNQSQMMTEVMKYIVEKHFDMFDTLSEQLTCLEKGTIKSQKKNFFNIGGEFTYRGVTYSIGTSYGRDAKLAQIRKAIILTGENPHDYQIDGLFNEKQLKEAEERYAEMKAANDTDINAETNMEAVEILCCFLSKFNNEAAMKLGCSNISNAFAMLSERYGVKETYIRNLRDSFDPFFPESGRKGWWQNMDKFGASRQMLIDRFKAFKNADEAFSFVKNAVGL